MFDWSHYIDFGQELLTKVDDFNCSEQSLTRSVISRAYYGAFGICKEVFEKKVAPVAQSGTSVHKNLIKAYSLVSKNSYKQISVDLDRLLTRRKLADYNPNKQFTRIDAETAVSEAVAIKEAALLL